MWFILIVTVLGLIALVFSILNLKLRKRIAHERREFLNAAGFTVHDRLKGPYKKQLFQPFEHLKDTLKHGGKRLVWLAVSPPRHNIDPSLRTQLFYHTFATSTGSSATVHHHTVAAFPCPPYWPALTIEPSSAFNRFFKRFAKNNTKTLELENPDFNARWTVKAEDSDFALLCLDPELQRFLTNLPGGHESDTWRIERGWICLLRRTKITNHNELLAFAEHPAMLLSYTAPELAYYNAPER